MLSDELTNALREAIKRAGSQASLAQESGIDQGRISDYLRGSVDLSNASVRTLQRLFPEMTIYFFKDQVLAKNTGIFNNKKVSGNYSTIIGEAGTVTTLDGQGEKALGHYRSLALESLIDLDIDPVAKNEVLKLLKNLKLK